MPNPAIPSSSICYDKSDGKYKDYSKTDNLVDVPDPTVGLGSAKGAFQAYYYPDCNRFKAFPAASNAILVQLKQDQVEKLVEMINYLTAVYKKDEDYGELSHKLGKIEVEIQELYKEKDEKNLHTRQEYIEDELQKLDKEVRSIADKYDIKLKSQALPPPPPPPSSPSPSLPPPGYSFSPPPSVELSGLMAELQRLSAEQAKATEQMIQIQNQLGVVSPSISNEMAQIGGKISNIETQMQNLLGGIPVQPPSLTLSPPVDQGLLEQLNSLQQQLTALQEEKNALEQHNKSLSQQLTDQALATSMQQAAANMSQAEFEAARSAKVALIEELNRLQYEKDQMNNNFQLANQQIQKLEEELLNSQQERNQQQASQTSQTSQYSEALKQLNEQLAAISEEKRLMTIEVEKSNVAAEKLNDKIDQLTTQKEELQNANAVLTERLNELQQTQNEISEDTNKKGKEIQTIQQELETRKEELEAKKQEISNLQDDINALKETDTQNKEKISSLAVEKEKTKSEIESLKSQLNLSTENKDLIEQKLQSLTQALNKIKLTETKVNITSKQAVNHLDESSKLLDLGVDKITEIETYIERLQTDVQKITDEKDTLIKETEKLQREKDTLLSDKAELDAKIAAHDAEKENATKSQTQIQAKNVELVEKLSKKDSEVEALKIKYDELVKQQKEKEQTYNETVQTLKNENESIKTQQKEWTKRNSELSDRIKTITEELVKIRDEPKEKIKTLQAKVNELNIQINNLQSNNEDLKKYSGTFSNECLQTYDGSLNCLQKMAKIFVGDDSLSQFRVTFNNPADSVKLMNKMRTIKPNIVAVQIQPSPSDIQQSFDNIIAVIRLSDSGAEIIRDVLTTPIAVKVYRNTKDKTLSAKTELILPFYNFTPGMMNVIVGEKIDSNSIPEDVKQAWQQAKLSLSYVTYTSYKDIKSTVEELKEAISADQSFIQQASDEVSNMSKKQLTDMYSKIRERLKQMTPNIDRNTCQSNREYILKQTKLLEKKKEIIPKIRNALENTKTGYIGTLTDEAKTNLKNEVNELEKQINDSTINKDIEEFVSSYSSINDVSDEDVVEVCSKIDSLKEKWKEDVLKVFDRLTNMYEDIVGAVRVYIRVKGTIDKPPDVVEVSPDEKEITITGAETKKYKDFSGIFDKSYTTLDVYSGIKETPTESGSDGLLVDLENERIVSDNQRKGIWHSVKQVLSGYSIVLFGYGLSGSGKTYTLIGKPTNGSRGVLYYALAYLSKYATIKVKSIFEEYVSLERSANASLAGKCILYYGTLSKTLSDKYIIKPDQINDILTQIKNFNDTSSQTISALNENISNILKLINLYRIKEERQKVTKNNPVSSRSHLYIVFEITKPDGKKGYITFVDMAGRENYKFLYDQMISKSYTIRYLLSKGTKITEQDLNNTFNATLIAETVKGDNLRDIGSVLSPSSDITTQKGQKEIREQIITKIKSIKYIIDLLFESLYINESINHLVYYFKNKMNLIKEGDIKTQTYDVTTTNYETKYYFSKPNEATTPIITQKLLNYLNNLNNDSSKPTKFIMMCMVRREKEYRDQTIETLDFASDIKST